MLSLVAIKCCAGHELPVPVPSFCCSPPVALTPSKLHRPPVHPWQVADAAGPVARMSSASFAWPMPANYQYGRRSPLDEDTCRGRLKVNLYQEAPPLSQPSQLQRLFAALWPPAGNGLLGLTLSSNADMPLAQLSDDALLPLTALELVFGGLAGWRRSIEHLLPSLLEQAPHLQHLALDTHQPLPQCLISYHGLTRLELWGIGDDDWPTGPYLQSESRSCTCTLVHA